MTSRPLTQGEEWLCRYVFKKSLNAFSHIYNVEVVKRKVIRGGFTPYGRINLDEHHYCEDFIGENLYKPIQPLKKVHHFLHELCHCWQHFVGMALMHEFFKGRRDARKERRAQGLHKHDMSKIDWRLAKHYSIYSYDISTGDDLMDFFMEEQCEIIADYFAMKLWGFQNIASKPSGAPYPLQSQLEAVLKNFLIDPAYPRYSSWIYNARANVREVR